MLKYFILILTTVLLNVTYGQSSNSEKQLIGEWTAVKLTKTRGPIVRVQKFSETLTLNPDKTFKSTVNPMWNGNWQIDGNKITYLFDKYSRSVKIKKLTETKLVVKYRDDVSRIKIVYKRTK